MSNLAIYLRHPIGFAVGIAIVILSNNASAVQKIYTTEGDFQGGNFDGTEVDVPIHAIRLSTTGSTFPVLWVANAGEDSVSRIDTNANCETARYKTWFNSGYHGAWTGPAPSRTAVDTEGNVYVANRHFEGRPASVMKILAEGGIDRNGNGVIDTSMDTSGNCRIETAEMQMPSDTNGNGVLEDSELTDERIAWIRQVGPNGGLGRSLCIGTNDTLWLGLYSAQQYYNLNPANGAVISGPYPVSYPPYGCVVAPNGILYSSTLSNTLGVFDTITHISSSHFDNIRQMYGIGAGNDRIYLGGYTGPYHFFNPSTGIFHLGRTTNSSFAVSTDGNGDIIAGQTTITKVRAPGDSGSTLLWSVGNPSGSGNTRGVIADSNNDVWVVNLDSNNVTKFNGNTGTLLATLPVGYQPYTYSDATGIAVRNFTNPTGFWTITTDGGSTGTQWDRITWNQEAEGSVPAGAVLVIQARAADEQANLGLQPWTTVGSGAGGLGLNGRYLETRIRMQPNTNGASPVMSDLKVETLIASCDFDGDDDVDIHDTNQQAAQRNQLVPPADARFDIDGDGKVTVLDIRKCILQCTLPRCESYPPPQ